jgi:hypothetical protein
MGNNIIGVGYLISGAGVGCYAGATTRPDLRPKEHTTALLNGRHFNADLQAAFDEHGIDKFSFVSFTPTCDPKKLPKIEMQLFEMVMAAGESLFNKIAPPKAHRVGYKLTEETKQKQSAAKTKVYKFKSPSGEIVESHGLRPLCEQFGLTMSEMSRLHQNKISQHKHWKKA